jgi:hypothetical protein
MPDSVIKRIKARAIKEKHELISDDNDDNDIDVTAGVENYDDDDDDDGDDDDDYDDDNEPNNDDDNQDDNNDPSVIALYTDMGASQDPELEEADESTGVPTYDTAGVDHKTTVVSSYDLDP